ncbi:MAG: hypothetical protein MJ010_05335 [Paludibacteraceae bacterium]|nr:hypothetical protein [Paludibacteraceae bacterium]
MRILVAPLNWGLGHATRCIPIINDLLKEGHEVMIGGDGESLELLRSEFPTLWCRYIPSFKIRYSKSNSQIFAMLRYLPSIIYYSIKEHREIKHIVKDLEIDMIVSDNRFGLFVSGIRTIYITHQIMVKMPKGLKWLEPLVYRLHRSIISNYDECWIPDYADKDKSLAGDLTHKYPVPDNAKFIGPLSRFKGMVCKPKHCEVLVVLSGVEPSRTIFEKNIRQRFSQNNTNVVIAKKYRATELLPYILGADKIICRSGYTSVMDMHLLGVSDKVEWSATPGQTEQEYLLSLLTSP